MSGTSPTAEPADRQAAVIVDDPGERSPESRLARLHLRTGSYALARAELETLAGAGALDDEALLDLAEVRWRTDDLTGAGEAAATSIAAGRIALIALVVAAEATAALGRPGEARRLAARALEMVDGAIDPIFAGMPRSDVWPARRIERVAPSDTPAVTSSVATVVTAAATGDSSLAPAGGDLAPPLVAMPAAVPVAVPMAVTHDPGREGGEPMPDPQGELTAARAALAAGDRAGAAIRLSIVLRLAPSLAPAVLDLAAAEPGPEFDLVRGDALRLVGRESQARRAFASAAARQPSVADVGSGSAPDAGEVAPRDVVAETVVADTLPGAGEPES